MAKGISALITAETLDTRSAPYKWVRKHQAEIKAAMPANGRIPWKTLQKIAASEGVDVTANTLRKAWVRLEQEGRPKRARTPKSESGPASPPVSAPPPRPTIAAPPIVPAAPPPPADDDDRPTYVEPRSRFHSRPGVDRARLPRSPTKDEPTDG